MLQRNQSTTIPAQFPEHEHLNCPRCDSTNTKFCYYNNYNLLQPRHFCKNCRRYWTKGGTLRKIPIGGGTRKITKRSSKSSLATTPPPPTQAELKSGPSALFGFNNSQSVMRSNESVDELTMNLSGGSETEGLNGASETAVLRRNQNGSDCGGWTNLSIFTSGSKFH